MERTSSLVDLSRREAALRSSLRVADARIRHHRHHHRLAILLVLACFCALPRQATSLQNLRIQVNNENLQSPPYVLDAIKRVEASEQQQQRAAASPAPEVSAPPASSESVVSAIQNSSPLANAAAALDEPEASPNSEENSPSGSSSFSVVREDAIEEVLDLEPESVLRLAPENLIDSVDSLEGAVAANGSASPAAAPAVDREADNSKPIESREEPDEESPNDFKRPSNGRLKPQLPVTSSHLKRPVVRVTSDLLSDGTEEHAQNSSHAPSQAPGPLTIDPNQPQHEQLPPVGSKSRVSPSVASEPNPDEGLEKKTAPLPPDTWEPNQIMAGVTNASQVPATVRRQYGHQTRTRITLGGGYQRNKLPPLVNPSSPEYVDSKPEKAQPPLERPVRQPAQPSPTSGDNSRVIEVPERIVLPASVFKQSTNTTNVQSVSIVRKRDSRCPANGVTSLEHPTACDRYYLCDDGYSSERTCPNGLMYGTRDTVRDFCVHRWQVVCGDKSIPNPISSPGCRWQNGIFNVQGSPKCTPDFYECTDGLFEVKKCTQSGQVYDDKTKSCQYAEQVGCAQEALAEFRCPPDDQTNTYWPFPRYFLNERSLIHCINDKPEIIRCRDYERVDTENLFCVPIDKAAPQVDETGAVIEVTARRTPANQREKGKKVKAPVEDDHSNE